MNHYCGMDFITLAHIPNGFYISKVTSFFEIKKWKLGEQFFCSKTYIKMFLSCNVIFLSYFVQVELL